jgi:hypothetical protein
MDMSRFGDAARSTVYLLVSFPLGVAYVAVVAAGVAVGLSLLLFVVGVVVLAGVAAVSRRLASFDAAIGARLFDAPAPTLASPRSASGLLDAAVAELSTPSGYRAAAYLVVRFAVGVAGFTFVATWLTLAAALLGAPLYYDSAAVTLGVVGVWEVQTLSGALAAAAAGVLVAVLGGLVVSSAGRVAAHGATYVLALPRPDAD